MKEFMKKNWLALTAVSLEALAFLVFLIFANINLELFFGVWTVIALVSLYVGARSLGGLGTVPMSAVELSPVDKTCSGRRAEVEVETKDNSFLCRFKTKDVVFSSLFVVNFVLFFIISKLS